MTYDLLMVISNKIAARQNEMNPFFKNDQMKSLIHSWTWQYMYLVSLKMYQHDVSKLHLPINEIAASNSESDQDTKAG